MNKIKLTTIQLFAATLLLCGLIIIQTPAAPTLRANGKIAFTSDRDGNSEIYVMNDDGSGQTRLTNSPDREDYPMWLNNFHPDWQSMPALADLNLTVTRSDDRNAVCLLGDCSLREAVNAANTTTFDDTLINFVSGLTTITLNDEIVINNVVNINQTLTINGLGANVLTIDGGAGTNRIFYINQDTVTISGVTLTGGNGMGASSSGNGGAIYTNQGSLTLDRVHVTGNTADGIGGGVKFAGVGTNRIINSTFSANFGYECGGFFNGGTLTVINSTITRNNTAMMDSTGGGGFCNEGNTTLRNVTITDNSSDIGGGISQIGGTLNFGNTIVAGNRHNSGPACYCFASEIYYYYQTTITSAGYNLIGDSPGDSTDTGGIITYQPTDIRDTNPLLGAMQNNGGTTPTRSLLAGSPAIDTGLNALVSPLAPAFDQRGTGFLRIRNGDGDNIATVDIGAFEVQTAARRTPFDFDGDGKSDISVFRPSSGVWYLNRVQGGFDAVQFGLSTDKLAPADFDGDGETDISVFRDGIWYWLNSSDGSFNAFQFGVAGDIPVPADFTGDGRAELAVYRSGTWYTWNLATSQFQAVQFGIASDRVVPADFDGDGKTDFAVYRDGVWYWLRSSDNGFRTVQFGIAADKPTVGDYDGDGKADPAVYRSGVWYVLGSSQGFYATQFGIASDIPTAADYDGDGKTDIAVYRTGNGTWYWLRSSDNGFRAVQFGIAEDKPIPAAFVP